MLKPITINPYKGNPKPNPETTPDQARTIGLINQGVHAVQQHRDIEK